VFKHLRSGILGHQLSRVVTAEAVERQCQSARPPPH
jgi:hypothetical protein